MPGDTIWRNTRAHCHDVDPDVFYEQRIAAFSYKTSQNLKPDDDQWKRTALMSHDVLHKIYGWDEKVKVLLLTPGEEHFPESKLNQKHSTFCRNHSTNPHFKKEIFSERTNEQLSLHLMHTQYKLLSPVKHYSLTVYPKYLNFNPFIK